MCWWDKIDVLLNGLNVAVDFINTYCNSEKYFLDLEIVECTCFFHLSQLEAWGFIKLTLGLSPKFYKPQFIDYGNFTRHSTVYLGLCLKSAILEIKCILIADPQIDVFNNQKLIVLYTMLFKFLPEMRNVVKVYNNHRRFIRIQRKNDEPKRKRELTEQIKCSEKDQMCLSVTFSGYLSGQSLSNLNEL